MATQYDFDVKRTEEVKKTLVSNLVIDPVKFNARFKMPNEQQLLKLANDIKNDPAGQKNPVAIWFFDKKPYVVEGFCRAMALQLINADEFDSGKELTPIKFRVIGNKVELQQIMLSNIAENEVRFPLTIMDKAYGMKMLYEQFKLTQAEIAEKYDVSQGTVSNYLKLMDLPEEVKEKIHDGNLSYSDAIMLSKVAPGKLSKVLDKIEESTVSSSKVDSVPGSKSAKEKSVKSAIEQATGKRFKRSQKDFVEMVGIEESEDVPKMPVEYFHLLNDICRWFDGDVDTSKLFELIQKRYEVKKK